MLLKLSIKMVHLELQYIEVDDILPVIDNLEVKCHRH